MKLLRRTTSALLFSALAASGAWAQKGETVKIAWIDGMSGPFANIGNNMIRTFEFLSARDANNPAGVKFQIVPFDSKGSPQESLVVLKAAIDQGIRYVAQGNSSAIAGALIDAINKHNERNPGKEVVFFNYAAVDPDLTNSKCSFWHFRFDADTSMKMEAMTTFIKDDKTVKKVYLINQNYGHGHQVAKFAKEGLARKRPDVQIVGEDLHPIGQVKDFAPYIAKAKAAGADTIITGNWGNDMSLLIKASKDAGLNANFYTYYAGAAGTPTVIGTAMEGKVKFVYGSYANLGGDHRKAWDEFRKKFNEDYSATTIYHLFKLLPPAIAKAKSTDPVKVAFALEGLSAQSFSGEITMRKSDHQLQQTLYQATWRKKDAKNDVDIENTGMTWVLERQFEPYVSSTPTTCDMKRPASS